MTDQTMLAVRYHQFGGSDVLTLEEVPRPTPQAGELLVKVISAGVLPADWKIRKGLFPLPVSFPSIPGTSFAGVIEAMGEGATGYRVGQEVFGRSVRGTYAEYAVAPIEAVALKPMSMSFDEAATLSGGATTAWRAITSAGVKAGDRVLIHGAAGGVGLFAVQFAKALGAYVFGTAGLENLDFIRSLGVDVAIDYKVKRFEEVAQDVDFVLDTIGGDTLNRSWSVIKRGGALVSIVGQPPVAHGQLLSIRVLPSSLATSQDLNEIVKLIDEGRVKTAVQHVYGINEVRQAQERSESGHGRGRIVLRIADSDSQDKSL
jgi:NADPH:quinone reductase-like Zn-dependent oxidoreductase